MVKTILTACLCICIASSAFAIDSEYVVSENALSEIQLKTNATIKAIVVKFDKDIIIYKTANGEQQKTINIADIKSIKNLNKENPSFKKTIILTSKEYYTGVILFQNREYMTLELSDATLKKINHQDVVDIVSEKDFSNENSRSKWKAGLFSAAFPGAGQFYSGNYGKGLVFGSTFITSGMTSFYFYNKAQNNWKKYKDSSYVNKNKYNQYKKDMYICYAMAGISSTLYVYNIIDAVTSFKYKYDVLNKNKEPVNTKTNASLFINNDTIGFSMALNF